MVILGLNLYYFMHKTFGKVKPNIRPLIAPAIIDTAIMIKSGTIISVVVCTVNMCFSNRKLKKSY
jgi:hypothetical protein